jgi:preprotein translocase SecE subunit
MNVIQRWKQFREFLTDVRKEAGKVSWPPKSDVVGTTTVVIVYTALVGVFLAAIDLVVTPLMDQILKLGH